MNCEWAHKWVEFDYKGQLVILQGLQDVSNTKLHEVSIDQVLK